MTEMPPAVHPGRLLKRELAARNVSANRLSLDIGVPSSRITDILNCRRSITADTAVRLGRYFGNSAQFWLDLQSQHDIAVVEKKRSVETKESFAAKRTVYHSVPTKGGWKVETRGQTISKHRTQKAAEAAAIKAGHKAEYQGGLGQAVLHKSNGTIREERTYPIGDQRAADSAKGSATGRPRRTRR